MKKTQTNWDVNKREFYNTVKNKKKEVEAVLEHSISSKGYVDFNDWYSLTYDWGFLRDILGDRQKCGLPWDYNTLIHLPVIVWTDGNGDEQRTVLKGEVTPDDLGFNITEMEAGDAIEIEKTEDEDGHIVFTVSNSQDLTKQTGYAADTYLKVVNNGTTEEPNLGFKWVNLGGLVQDNLLQWDDTTKEIFKGESGNYTIVSDIKFKDQTKTVSELIDAKSEVEVSTQKVSGAADIYSINIDGTDYNLAGSGDITEEEVDAKILVETTRATEAEKTLENNKQDKLTSESEISVKSINVGSVALNETVLTNLDTQVTKNTQAISDEVTRAEAAEQEISEALMTEQSTREQIDEELNTAKVDKISDASKVYCTSASGEQTAVPYNTLAVAGTIATRTDDGTLNVATPTADANATTKAYVDTQLATKQATISDLSTIRSGAELGATAVQPAALGDYYTKDETDSEIDTKISQSVGRYITSSAAGANFSTKAALTAGPYYYNGETATLIATDYAIVAADEDHDNAQTRYIYSGSQWNYQYTISTTITAAQQAALDSGIDSTKVSTYSGYATSKQDTLTETQLAAVNSGITSALVSNISTNAEAISTETSERKSAIDTCEKLSNKTTSLTTASTDDQYPSAKATFDALDEVYEDLNGRVETIEGNYVTLDTTQTISGDKTFGNIYCSTPGSTYGVANKNYVDTQVSAEATTRSTADTTLQTNIDNEATRVNEKYTYSTTAPTEAATDGGIHIVYLEEEPETKYDGYIYLIKEE